MREPCCVCSSTPRGPTLPPAVQTRTSASWSSTPGSSPPPSLDTRRSPLGCASPTTWSTSSLSLLMGKMVWTGVMCSSVKLVVLISVVGVFMPVSCKLVWGQCEAVGLDFCGENFMADFPDNFVRHFLHEDSLYAASLFQSAFLFKGTRLLKRCFVYELFQAEMNIVCLCDVYKYVFSSLEWKIVFSRNRIQCVFAIKIILKNPNLHDEYSLCDVCRYVQWNIVCFKNKIQMVFPIWQQEQKTAWCLRLCLQFPLTQNWML